MYGSKANIGIMGAGAIGSVIGGMLSKEGHNVTLIGRNPHMDEVLKKGLHIRGIWGNFIVKGMKALTAPPDQPQDIVFLTVKSFDTASAAQQMLPMIGNDTVVVSLQNGLGNIEILGEIIGKDKTIGGMAIFGAIMPEPGCVEVTVIASEMLVGEIDGTITKRVNSIARILDSANIPTKTSDNIIRDIWSKVLYNIALNPLSAIFQVPYGSIADNPHTRWLSEQMIIEGFHVSRAAGVDLGMDSPQEYLEILWNEKLPPTRNHRSSMLQDIIHGKRTEIDHINGAVTILGEEYGIKTPYNSAVVSMVKAKETLTNYL